MSKKWSSPVYVFFKKTPQIEYKGGHRCHVFSCAAGSCKGRNGRNVIRFLDKGDSNSTSNLLRHARICWGTEAVEAATVTKDLDAAREVLGKTKLRDGSILAEFQRLSKDKVTYRHTQHTTSEARYVSFFKNPFLPFFHACPRAEIVRWVAESKRPFQIVKDRGFQNLMKTGRPAYPIPSPETVSRDVKNVFVRVRKRIAKMLQV
jgi:hypothetical protein